jgi:glutaconyl-CoA decarboxylase
MANNGKTVNAPLPGKVIAVQVKNGDMVERGDLLLVLEAMKMHNKILSPFKGIIQEVKVSPGQTVSTGEPLVLLA